MNAFVKPENTRRAAALAGLLLALLLLLAPQSCRALEQRTTKTDEGVLRIEYVDEDGNAVFNSALGCAVILRTLDSLGRPLTDLYYDAEGVPMALEKGNYGVTREYSGDWVSVYTYLGADGEPVMVKYGYAGYRRTCDEQGRTASTIFFDTSGRPVVLSGGESGYSYEYDEDGVRIARSCLGADGSLIMNRKGYCTLRYTYGPDGNIEYEWYYDLHGEPIRLRRGEYGIRRIYTDGVYSDGAPVDRNGKELFRLDRFLYGNPAVVLGAALLLLALLWRLKGGARGTLMVLYAGFILYMTLYSRDPSAARTLYLNPFWSYRQAFSDTGRALHILNNVMLFVPLGFDAGLSGPGKGRRIRLALAVLLSLGVETVQYYTGMGFCDVDDFLSNLLGLLLGLWAGSALFRLKKDGVKEENGRQDTEKLRFLRLLARGIYRSRVICLDPGARERIARGGCIAVCNHLAISDGPVVLAALKGRFCPIVARDWYEKPLLRPILDAAECIPVDRDRAGLEWIRRARTALKEGKTILVFPEGKVRKDGVLGEFKQGTALLCMLTGAPVVPLSIAGLYTVFRPARLTVGETLKPDRASLGEEEGRKRFCAQLRETVAHNRDPQGKTAASPRQTGERKRQEG